MVLKNKNIKVFDNLFFIYAITIFLLIGFRPIGIDGFYDTAMYINWFKQSQTVFSYNEDIGFDIFTFFIAQFFNERIFFVICSLLSFTLLFFVCKKLFKEDWMLLFLAFLSSLYFWNHQVFTIRQGIATMIFLLGFIQKKATWRLGLLLLAVSFHKSLLLPLLCIPFLYVKSITTRQYVYFWGISILFSIFGGVEPLVSYLQKLSLGEKFDFYFNKLEVSYFSLRWDFVLYSLFIIVFGIYQKGNLMKNNKMYEKALNFFILSNTFFILLMPFVDGHLHRFFFLSGFIVPVVIFYPLIELSKSRYITFLKFFIPYYLIIFGFILFKIVNQGGKYVL
ncbi:EpsG family protein [Riemerella anatipestifer]|uniref:EpsG family protein n=1 Tax=Riemerella anatipestifer TaxID=34085 RepID=UPI0007F8D582|nr:EpsG family protein [Riemerella anatipestifer]MCQ4062688.1 EpsG family protein [Riemerella anatipestifer]MCQ4156845.1 EpsG family protein [Riemerella anatipestifer]MCT6722315.1 EpsG family protein [Riemerella anatipestifer]MCT6751258.1 EpsG family protein [Riemerella anatipestifer]MCT6752793.1 EpsG family protein [Riemerella anatipestifer]